MALEQTDEQPTDLESHLLHAVSNVITTVLFGDRLDYHDPIHDDLQFSKYAGLTFLAHMVPAVKVGYSLYVRRIRKYIHLHRLAISIKCIYTMRFIPKKPGSTNLEA